ncbi:hypothetical protein SERLA73DRAFT_70153 [Serpula lacrymans var. lacrymans S7.3]|uniref:Uncharacterized protein n=2 Tax=Serpula lacrymans var. lacrymans TaxID=341189 RepID=F8PM28_SERL3|nr:uncharacterized protein SERLADRAFT_434276 [Serpula lacrymans var. lacrymans S7.9]EGO02660.1 hypothetical protein SERLA73DRAFT_70153 [Serpula lacrymans var. lacrymans S7.3]EGO28366.1 hypothetical protein SERLADRAFT_434276 [Serpula lacrymans var. lacrymans S7.9]
MAGIPFGQEDLDPNWGDNLLWGITDDLYCSCGDDEEWFYVQAANITELGFIPV